MTSFKISDIYYASGIVEYHLWYLSSLICCVPLLYMIISRGLINKAIIVTFLLNIIGVFLPVINQDMWIITRDAIFFGMFYMTLGAYMFKKEKSLPKLNGFQYSILILIISSLMLIEAYIYRTKFNSTGDYFILTIPFSILIFLFCIRIKRF